MGIDVHALHLLKHARQFGELGDTVMIGRQAIHVEAGRLERLTGHVRREDEIYCERLLQESFGAATVDSIDYSDYEQASVIHDMNLPLPAGMREYHTVLDFGTVEHVFDISQALTNMVSLCEKGGQILHVSPANNFCGHGLWQISPELFFSLYCERNGFGDTEVFVASRKDQNNWYKVKKVHDELRAHIKSTTRMSAVCRTVRHEKREGPLQVQQSEYIYEWGKTDHNGGDHAAATVEPSNAPLNKLRYKLFRGLSGLNPSLTRVHLS